MKHFGILKCLRVVVSQKAKKLGNSLKLVDKLWASMPSWSLSHFQNCCSHFDTVSEYAVCGRYIIVRCCTYKFIISIQIDLVSINLILGGLSLQWLEAGLWLPARDRGQVTRMRALNPTSRPVVSDKSPSLSSLQKRIPTKMESSETS